MRVLTANARQKLGPLAFSPDGRFLAAGTDSLWTRHSLIRVWVLCDSATPAWAGYPGQVNQLAFDPGGCLLSIPGARGMRIDPGTGAAVKDQFLIDFIPVSLAVDGRMAAANRYYPAARAVTLRLAKYGSAGWSEAWQIDVPYDEDREKGYWCPPLIDPVNNRITRAYKRGPASGAVAEIGLRTFDAETGREIGEWGGELTVSYPQQWTVGPAGVLVLLCGSAFHVVDPNRTDAAPVRRANTSHKHFTDAAFSPDGRWLATTSNDALVTIWETATWSVARQYAWDVGRLRSVAFSPDGTLAAAGSDTGRVVVWDFDF